ncbi:MAG: HEAT repeat domain-containing protein [Planctomycetota bacterium]|jgi:hypothetical protein|nr:HEAT repeat domain-containing protein [Planctomycetota bacterium]
MFPTNHFSVSRSLLAAAICLSAGCTGIGTLPPVPQVSLGHHPGCRDGACVPHCPVRPDVQGYYATSWRRWPVAKAAEPAADDGSTPAGAPRSVVPGPDEESSSPQIDEFPATDSFPAAESFPTAPPLPARPLAPPADAGSGPMLPQPRQPAPATPRPLPAAPNKLPAAEEKPTVPDSEENLFEARAADRRIAVIASQAAVARAASVAEQERYTKQLVNQLLSEHDGGVRARIVEEAASFQTATADAICRGGGADPDPRVRAAICEIWRRRGGAEAIAILAERARDDMDLGVRLRAIRGLGELGDEQAVATLIGLLEDPDPAVQQRVCLALGQATGLRLGDDPRAWQRWAADPEASQRWSLFNSLRDLF